MKTFTFWTVLIKILALSILFSSFTWLASTVSALYDLINGNENQSDLAMFIVATLVFYILILRILLFKTAWVIKILKLDKNMEEKIDLTIQPSSLLQIAIAVIGGLLFVNNLPTFIGTLIEYFRHGTGSIHFDRSTSLVVYLLKSLVGYLLFTNSRSVGTFVFKQTDKTDQTV